jgi:RNA polymerase sigma-70 factor (ECF subfamily)
MENPETAFEKMISENQLLIHKVCNIYGRSETDREDLFQEITIQLWKSYASFEHRSKLSTWLYRVALNTAIAQQRREKRMPQTKSLSEVEMRIPDAGKSEKDEEALQDLQQAIRRLKSVERAIIFLYLEEKSYQEIANIIGISPKNVGVKIVRIKAKLLNMLKRK